MNSDSDAESFISFELNKQKHYFYNLNHSSEIFNLKLFAVNKSLDQIDEKIITHSFSLAIYTYLWIVRL